MRSPRESKTTKTLTVILCVVIVLSLAVFLAVLSQVVGPAARNQSEETSAPTEATDAADVTEATELSATEPEQTEFTGSALEFPLSADEGKLTVESLFQFSGFNPDCGGQEGTDIAAIMLKNTSGSHLTNALLTLTMADGTALNFMVADLPADGSAMVFSRENDSIEMDAVCVNVSCQTAYEETTPLMADKLAISAEGTVLTVTNITGEDLSDIVVHCHCVLDEDCFGGLTYQYVIDTLPAGASTTVDAYDCYMGEAEAVRIGIGS